MELFFVPFAGLGELYVWGFRRACGSKHGDLLLPVQVHCGKRRVHSASGGRSHSLALTGQFIRSALCDRYNPVYMMPTFSSCDWCRSTPALPHYLCGELPHYVNNQDRIRTLQVPTPIITVEPLIRPTYFQWFIFFLEFRMRRSHMYSTVLTYLTVRTYMYLTVHDVVFGFRIQKTLAATYGPTSADLEYNLIQQSGQFIARVSSI